MMLVPLLSLLLLLLTGGGAGVASVERVSVNAGANVTLSCGADSRSGQSVLWMWGSDKGGPRFMPTDNGELVISNVEPGDQRVYTCQDAENNESLHSVSLIVRTVPPAVVNLTVLPKSVFATVAWGVAGDGGAPITGFRLYYRRDKSHLSPKEERELSDKHEKVSPYEWKEVGDIPASATSQDVYNLMPNSTYYFRMCALNSLGCSKNVSVLANTDFDRAEVQAAKDEKRAIREEEQKDADDKGSVSMLKIWIVGVGVFLITFALIGFGISLLLIKNCDGTKRRGSGETTEEEAMELVPHITLNPSFNIDMLEFHDPSTVQQSNEDLIVDVVANSQQNGRCREIMDSCENDQELNLINSPIHRPQQQQQQQQQLSLDLGGSSNSINRPNG